MLEGNKETIFSCLSHSGAIYRMDAIGFSVIHKLTDENTINAITQLKNDFTSFDGYSVSDFACAALDLLNIEKYSGNSDVVHKLIQSKFAFLKISKKAS